MQPMVTPYAATRHAEKLASMQNTFSGVTNMINSFANIKQQEDYKKNVKVITDVTQAWQRASQAQIVLNDPTATPQMKEIAQKSLQENKDQIDAIMSDDKNRSMISKAFNKSFVDTEQNKKNAEFIKAGDQGLKNAQSAYAAGTTANTPGEKAISDYLKPGGPTRGAPPPVSPALTGAPGAAPIPPPKTAEEAAKAPQVATGQRASAGWADKLMAGQPSAITPNPLYAAQLAQYNKMQDLYMQHVVPKVIDYAGRQYTAWLNNTEAGKRQNARMEAMQQMMQTKMDEALKAANIKANAYLKGTAMQVNARLKIAQDQLNAKLGVITDPRIRNNPALASKIAAQGFKTYDDAIAASTRNINTWETNIANRDAGRAAAIKGQPQDVIDKYDADTNDLKGRLAQEKVFAEQMQTMRGKYIENVFPETARIGVPPAPTAATTSEQQSGLWDRFWNHVRGGASTGSAWSGVASGAGPAKPGAPPPAGQAPTTPPEVQPGEDDYTTGDIKAIPDDNEGSDAQFMFSDQ
jgi:hypothetical protein